MLDNAGMERLFDVLVATAADGGIAARADDLLDIVVTLATLVMCTTAEKAGGRAVLTEIISEFQSRVEEEALVRWNKRYPADCH